jgi:hypothetical protein
MPRPSARSRVPTAADGFGRIRARAATRATSRSPRPASPLSGQRTTALGRVSPARQVVDLVHHQQVAMAAEFGQAEVRGRRHALIRGDVLIQPATGVRLIFGRAHPERVAQVGTPGGVSEGFLRLQPQAVARHHPAYPLDHPRWAPAHAPSASAAAICTARCYCCRHIAQRRLARSDSASNAEHLALVGTQRSSSGRGHARRDGP